MTPPQVDEIEISVFGPGYGESILIHAGSGRWIIIDSCLADDRKTPAPLQYMADMGVDASADVCAVVASHWHDDHITGLSVILEACVNAGFWHSAALTIAEFRAFLAIHDNQLTQLDHGSTEMLKCLKLMEASGRSAKRLIEGSLVAEWRASTLAHGKATRLLALSPSSKRFDRFLHAIGAELAALPKKSKTRLDSGRNDLSIASLLGADLEHDDDPNLGWNAVVNDRVGRGPKAVMFKVPHHGSKDAHNDKVWSELLSEDVVSVVTPWRVAGRRLPQDKDKSRISGLSKRAYLTAETPHALKRLHSREALRHIRKSGSNLRGALYRCGHVRIRFPAADLENREIALFNGAKQF